MGSGGRERIFNPTPTPALPLKGREKFPRRNCEIPFSRSYY